MAAAYCPQCGTAIPEGAAQCRACGQPVAPARRRMPAIVIVLIALGCLTFLVAFLGIVAALFVPNFIDALHKAKQKRTVADLQEVAAALDQRALAQPAGAAPYPAAGSLEELAAELAGYHQALPVIDGWEHPLSYACEPDPSGSGCTDYRLASPGRDGVFEYGDLWGYEVASFPRTEYDGDLVLSPQGFVRWPE